MEEIKGNSLRYRDDAGIVVQVPAQTILWAAGMRATPLTEIVGRRSGADLGGGGRTKVDGQLNLPGDPDVFAIGDRVHVPAY